MEIKQDLKTNWKAAESFLIYHLRPNHRQGYDYSDIKATWDKLRDRLKLNDQDNYMSSAIKSDKNDCSIEDFINPDMFLTCKDGLLPRTGTMDDVLKGTGINLDEDFEIVFLGTGACLPSKYRNVSSTLVKIR